MYITKIILTNWMCYAGTHELKLEAKPYAIVANRDGDTDSSNMAGKTALMEAIGFALYGAHRFRTEDEWITRGAESGEVLVVTDDGWTFWRTRQRGKSTRFFVAVKGAHGKPFVGKEAEEKLRQLVGFGEDDWYATCAMAQRQMALFVLAKPEERMRMVEGWFDLGKLEEAASKAEADTAKYRARALALETVGRANKPTVDLENLATEAKDLSVKAKAAADARVVLAKAEMIERQLAELNEHFEAVPDAVEALPTDRASMAACDIRMGEARSKLRLVEPVAKGQFDGQCPVVGIPCPARAEVEGQRHHAQKQTTELKGLIDAENLQYAEFQRRVRAEEESKRVRAAVAKENQQLEQMRADLERQYDELPEPGEHEPGAEERARAAQEALGRAKAEMEHWERTEAAYRVAQQELSEVRAKLALTQAAAAVMGRQGAQRRIAERALQVIEADANTMLADGGIPLQVAMRWGREGQGPARACPECGAAFPTSTKVKVCVCGAARGQHIVPKLEVELSDRSGAAEDMAGVAMQLAAGAWLRRRRGAAWAVALIDEPFGACDASNRKALGRQLASLLCGRHGFAQAFVVAHSAETLDAMPGRLLVEWSGGRSTVRVIA